MSPGEKAQLAEERRLAECAADEARRAKETEENRAAVVAEAAKLEAAFGRWPARDEPLTGDAESLSLRVRAGGRSVGHDLPMILQDTREPDPDHDAESALFWPMVYQRASKAAAGHVEALPLSRVCLATGDYSLPGLEHLVAIERKTVPDLLGTLFGRTVDSVGEAKSNLDRFRGELERMRAMPAGSFRLIVIEGERRDIWTGKHRSRVSAVSIIGLIDSLFVDYNVPNVFAGDRAGAQLLVGTTLRRIWEQAHGDGEGFKKAIERGVAGHRPWLAQRTGEVI